MPEVKVIKIRGQLHQVSHNGMSGYRTLCGKTASFGHQVYHLRIDEITCPECAKRAVIRNQHSQTERFTDRRLK